MQKWFHILTMASQSMQFTMHSLPRAPSQALLRRLILSLSFLILPVQQTRRELLVTLLSTVGLYVRNHSLF